MSNVIRLPDRPEIACRYQPGDIGRALREGLKHEQIAGDIESAFKALLFENGPEDVLAAREIIADLLNANR